MIYKIFIGLNSKIIHLLISMVLVSFANSASLDEMEMREIARAYEAVISYKRTWTTNPLHWAAFWSCNDCKKLEASVCECYAHVPITSLSGSFRDFLYSDANVPPHSPITPHRRSGKDGKVNCFIIDPDLVSRVDPLYEEEPSVYCLNKGQLPMKINGEFDSTNLMYNFRTLGVMSEIQKGTPLSLDELMRLLGFFNYAKTGEAMPVKLIDALIILDEDMRRKGMRKRELPPELQSPTNIMTLPKPDHMNRIFGALGCWLDPEFKPCIRVMETSPSLDAITDDGGLRPRSYSETLSQNLIPGTQNHRGPRFWNTTIHDPLTHFGPALFLSKDIWGIVEFLNLFLKNMVLEENLEKQSLQLATIIDSALAFSSNSPVMLMHLGIKAEGAESSAFDLVQKMTLADLISKIALGTTPGDEDVKRALQIEMLRLYQDVFDQPQKNQLEEWFKGFSRGIEKMPEQTKQLGDAFTKLYFAIQPYILKPTAAEQYSLALKLRDSQGGEVDLEKARSLFETVLDSDELTLTEKAISQIVLAIMYRDAEGGDARPEKARALFEEALDSGQLSPQNTAIVQFNLANMYREAQGGEEQPRKARYLFKNVLKSGELLPATKYASQVLLAFMYKNAEGGHTRVKEARSLLEEALDSGELTPYKKAEAQCGLSEIYRKVQEGDARLEKARSLLEEALDSGELIPHNKAVVQMHLACMYKDAKGGDARPEKARVLFEEALVSDKLPPQGSALVQSKLSEM